MTPEIIQACIDERTRIMAWQKIAKKREMELRIMISNALIPKPIFGKNKGTFNGKSFIADYPQKIEVDPATIDNVLAIMPTGVCDKAVVKNWKFVKAEYNKLPEHLKKALDQGLISKLGTITLEI